MAIRGIISGSCYISDVIVVDITTRKIVLKFSTHLPEFGNAKYFSTCSYFVLQE
ncbi:hypothetical protein DAPPUDRAFT_345547, partial [Daphnia pulex]